MRILEMLESELLEGFFVFFGRYGIEENILSRQNNYDQR